MEGIYYVKESATILIHEAVVAMGCQRPELGEVRELAIHPPGTEAQLKNF